MNSEAVKASAEALTGFVLALKISKDEKRTLLTLIGEHDRNVKEFIYAKNAMKGERTVKKFVKINVDVNHAVQGLADTEAGRLFKGILEYSVTGEEVALPGRERLLFDMVKTQMQRETEKTRYSAPRAMCRSVPPFQRS